MEARLSVVARARSRPVSTRDPETMQAIYALKTAAAFDVALSAGLTAAGEPERFREPVKAFSRYLGVAYQVINDLKDYDPDMLARSDAARAFPVTWPTLPQALAVRAGGEPVARRMLEIAGDGLSGPESMLAVRGLYEELGVLEKAEKLVEAYRERALRRADSVGHDRLRELMTFIAQAVLAY